SSFDRLMKQAPFRKYMEGPVTPHRELVAPALLKIKAMTGQGQIRTGELTKVIDDPAPTAPCTLQNPKI
ncbi:MAG: hypothetical protein WD995_11005, partial [Gemmatimonadota bacterium]